MYLNIYYKRIFCDFSNSPQDNLYTTTYGHKSISIDTLLMYELISFTLLFHAVKS